MQPKLRHNDWPTSGHKKIYLLRCPISNDVKYVGCTGSPLASRLLNHLSTTAKKPSKWMLKLKSKNLRPIIEEICEAKSKDAVFHEIYWINYFRLEGVKLLNTRIT